MSRRMNRMFKMIPKRFRERGSALLASLMVMVGLSLLGLAFVAISETESAISVNERNHSQTVGLAESGARLVVQWFQFPNQMLALNLMPPANTNNFKTQRVSGAYTGYYKANAGELFCDLPFGPTDNDKFFGDEVSADIVITRNTNPGIAFLDAFNDTFLGPEGTLNARPTGEITEIRVFAPPIVGGTLQPAAAPRFWVGGTRYGVATIMVRAEKFDRPLAAGGRRSIARAECRIVVSQFPLPTPGGPLQSATALATNGAFNVNWGLVSAQQSLDLQKDYGTIPWFNSYERIHFNRGYDSSVEWAVNTNYVPGDIVRPMSATITANPVLRFHEYKVTNGGNSGGAEPNWASAVTSGSTVTQGGLTYQEQSVTAYPITTGGPIGASNTQWLYFIARGNIAVEDPWFQARSFQDIVGAATSNAQPNAFPYTNLGVLPFTQAKSTTWNTHHFQFQSFDQYPQFKQLVFPIINYDFWKSAAMAGNGQQGVRYLQWVAADTYSDGITTKTFRNWASSQSGFYFFETTNNQNPQNSGPGILAPTVSINGGGAYMAGFMYLNAPFRTTGLSGPTGWFNQPSEPYFDIGYRKVAEVASATAAVGDFEKDASGSPVVSGAFNNEWNYQDLPWSNTGAVGGGTKNAEFDVRVEQRSVHDPSDTGNPTSRYNGWFVQPYREGCFPGNNACGTCNCSEPHEPYLNLLYNGNPLTLTISWQDPSAQSRRPKYTLTGAGAKGGRTDTPIVCSAASTVAECTSNAYDIDGGLVQLDPATDGVFFVEGNFDSTGNADYYGSVLVGIGGVNPKGTPQVWFDESLTRGQWRPPGLPRVMVTSVETDR